MRRRLADRYHHVQNLRDHLQQFLDRKRTCLPEVEDIPLREGSTNTQGLRASLADRTGTVESCAEAACEPTEKTSQPQAQPGAEVPTTTREQEPELACLTYAEREARRSVETSVMYAMSTFWHCTRREWDNGPSPERCA